MRASALKARESMRETIEAEIADLDGQMADRANASNWDKLQEWSAQRRELDAQRQRSYQRWEALEELLAGEA